jgi:hypothetical protein
MVDALYILVACIALSSSAVAQDAPMPTDCIAIAKQIQTATNVRFVRTRSIDTLVSEPERTAGLGASSITMQCPPWASGLDPLPYSYAVTIWAEASDPPKAFHELAGRVGTILTGEKPETLIEASRHCLHKALKSEFRYSGVLTPKATVKCQFDPTVRPPNVAIWRRAPTDVEDVFPNKAP